MRKPYSEVRQSITQSSAFFIVISTHDLNVSIAISVPISLSFARPHVEGAVSETNANGIAEFSSDIA
jgi:hypothetical protein